MKNRLLKLVALVVLLAPLFVTNTANGQSVPIVTPSTAGVCGVKANTCDAGVLGDNAQQPDGSYQWYCTGVGGGATSRLCSTPPAPKVTELTDCWFLSMEDQIKVDMDTGEKTSLYARGLSFCTGVGIPGQLQDYYKGNVEGFNNVTVDVYYSTKTVPANRKTIDVFISFQEQQFGAIYEPALYIQAQGLTMNKRMDQAFGVFRAQHFDAVYEEVPGGGILVGGQAFVGTVQLYRVGKGGGVGMVGK